MKDEVDTILANEQGGFKKNKSSFDNIFWLRSSLYINLTLRTRLIVFIVLTLKYDGNILKSINDH